MSRIFQVFGYKRKLKPLEADAATLAADVVGGQMTGLQQVAEVEGLTLDDEVALEVVAGLQTGVGRLYNLKLQTA